MNDLKLYQSALGAVVFIRQFMHLNDCYFRGLDDALQPFVDAVLARIPDLVKCEKSDAK